MRRLSSLLCVCICATPAFAGGAGKVLLDLWDAAYLGDGKAGYVHTVAKEIDVEGKKVIQTTIELRLTVKRFKDTVQMSADTGDYQTPDGKVLGVFMRHYLAKKQTMQVDGIVAGDKIHLDLNGDKKANPWNPAVVGLLKQQTLFKDRNVKEGDKFDYLTFEPSINRLLKVAVIVKGYREVEWPGARQKRKLLLVETIPEKIELKRSPETVENIQLPVNQIWLDERLEPAKSEVDMPGLGPIVCYRTTKAQALAPGPVAQLTDIGIGQLVRLKNRILKPYETTAAVYRITIRKDDDPSSTFSRDNRQQVKKVQGNTFELHVKASKETDGEIAEKEPSAEFLQSSYFITSDDAKVKELARRAVGGETDPWKKALRIERWVHEHMKATYNEALATADHVARTLEGDCTEFSMLAAAMCRAEEIPSRTAIGLIYAEPSEVDRAPCFAFHMWTEVWIKGRWIPIDATLGKGYVGATHLKITDHSWSDVRTLTPILPVLRVVGRVSIEILSAETR
jgi:transglutaminase-like putative cysteine protease